MRDLKYRQPLFYDLNGEKFREWFYWGFTRGKEHGFTSPQNHQSKNYQYTGLKDKNGVEIWEGDILKQFGHTCEVVFKLGCFGYMGDIINNFIAYGTHHHIDWDMPNVEVIGNIYENPELSK